VALAKTNEKRHAIIVLPSGGGGNIARRSQRRWLSRGSVSYTPPVEELLNRVLPLLRHEPQTTGLAALRFWGQTNERVSTWMAGADPIHLETMHASLRLHTLSMDEVDLHELRSIYDGLQQTLGDDGRIAFARIQSCGYLRSNDEIVTAKVSAQVANGIIADEFMPPDTTSSSYHRLLSEIQMYLHAHEVNDRRERAGNRPINSLWIWGGGEAPQKTVRRIPPLFTEDPLFKGYWESCTGVTDTWDGDFDRCLATAVSDFVVVTQDESGEARLSMVAECLDGLRNLLAVRRIDTATLLFRDGLSVEIGRYSWLKFWRKESPLLMQPLPYE
jgi:hypothetical protein